MFWKKEADLGLFVHDHLAQGQAAGVDIFVFTSKIIRMDNKINSIYKLKNIYFYGVWFVALMLVVVSANLYSQYLDKNNALSRWSSFINEISDQVDNYPYYAGIIVRDLKYGFSYYYQGSRKFISASLIKLPIMCAVYKKVDDGTLSFDDTITLTKSSKDQCILLKRYMVLPATLIWICMEMGRDKKIER